MQKCPLFLHADQLLKEILNFLSFLAIVKALEISSKSTITVMTLGSSISGISHIVSSSLGQDVSVLMDSRVSEIHVYMYVRIWVVIS